MINIDELSPEKIFEKLTNEKHAARAKYLAMYSSWLGGIVKNPGLMTVPIDDHMVHRGDGVFEAIKCVGGKIYALDRHLERLQRSAAAIGLQSPHSAQELREVCVATVRAAGAGDCLLRLYLSRGPGSFSVNPYDVIGAQVYLVVTRFHELGDEIYERGVTADVSSLQVKEGFFATVKSCNYLQNVLMKKEALERGVDFTISRDEAGCLAEGATENFAIVSGGGELLVPDFKRTLRGITVVRAMELAQEHLLPSGLVQGVKTCALSLEDVARAREVMVIGTTLDCLAITRFRGQKIGDAVAGPVARELRVLLKNDMSSGPLAVHVE